MDATRAMPSAPGCVFSILPNLHLDGGRLSSLMRTRLVIGGGGTEIATWFAVAVLRCIPCSNAPKGFVGFAVIFAKLRAVIPLDVANLDRLRN